MFQEKRPLFLYCLSPVHMGAGTALGVIDNPIQREKHTGHPVMAGSGLKGALRHDRSQEWDEDKLLSIFGPNTDDTAEYAGAVSFSDAQLVAFPVRSPKRTFVYATSPTALARAARLHHSADVVCPWVGTIPMVQTDQCCIVDPDLKTGEKVALESFEFTAIDHEISTISKWLAEHALPQGDAYKFFRDKMKNDLVLLSDEDFNYFVQNSTVVEPHVRIDDVTGTASEGGLFYTENLPPESLMLSLIMASKERRRNGNKLSAKEVMNLLVDGNDKISGIKELMFQIGGEATTGRGQVVLSVLGKEGE